MFNIQNEYKNQNMLTGLFAYKGYDWWWHNLTAIDAETGEEKQFFFEYFIINPKKAQDVPTFGQKGEKPSYFMVKAGCWGKDHTQLHRFFPWKHTHAQYGAPFSVGAADCFCSNDRMRGSISITPEEAKNHPEWMCDSGVIKWNLKINKEVAFNVGYGTSNTFRTMKAFEMYWHAEGMKSKYEGEIWFNGRYYVVKPETSYGYADKNWGRNFTSPWVWLSSNCLYSKTQNKKLENSVFDIGGGKPKVFFIPIKRKLLGAFYYEGEEYEYNFSKFWHPSKTLFDCKVTEDKVIWDVTQENKHSIMETHVECLIEDMLKVNYESPDGKKRHNNLYNGGNGVGTIKLYKKLGKEKELIDEIEATHIGCEWGEYDEEAK